MQQPPRANRYRDAWCGELTAERADSPARVAGWVHRRRDHGGLIFIDLRDRSGLVQLVFHPDRAPEAHAAAHRLRSEDVLTAAGTVARRDEKNINPDLPTGEVELTVDTFELLADAETPPFPIDEDGPVDELTRMRHRPLDLRRGRMQDAITLRHAIITSIRDTLNARDFLEIETPLLTRSTPEGARDFIVPTRWDPPSFYALPQSPQLYKELLMMAGFERYYQIARCFRDEDSRADRLPEFTQLDMELSFVDEEDVIDVAEAVISAALAVGGLELPAPPWPRVSYADAVARYGSDRPDRRFELDIVDLGEAVAGTEFKVFASVRASGGVVRGINAGARELARKDLDALTETAKAAGAGGLVWAFVQDDGTWRSPIAKFLSPDEVAGMTERFGGSPGDLFLIVADTAEVVARVLGVLRLELAERFALVAPGAHDIHWITDFPLFEYDEEGDRWDAVHHPFTSPAGELTDPATAMARAYDLVLDGAEIGGGSIRISDPAVQQRVLELSGISAEEAQERFGFLLDAMKYGTPPLGGIAFGIDRIVALCAGRESIREVIAFPKTASGLDPLTGAPAAIDDVQLKPLGLRPVQKG